jgi:hypothetical protein
MAYPALMIDCPSIVLASVWQRTGVASEAVLLDIETTNWSATAWARRRPEGQLGQDLPFPRGGVERPTGGWVRRHAPRAGRALVFRLHDDRLA